MKLVYFFSIDDRGVTVGSIYEKKKPKVNAQTENCSSNTDLVSPIDPGFYGPQSSDRHLQQFASSHLKL